ncbi:MAG TPA: PfkB family carbohydrate kinase [Phenylobacterium sp.]|nr:PfkB family carbohydrate kinase [Phenylobacterium sp.]
MALALILSSHVAASRVGGSAQVLALAQFRIDAMLAPTVLYGRHPGWGPPGGGPVPAETFGGMLEGVEANGLHAQIDLVLTGYFASAAQVTAAVRAIDGVRAAPRDRGARRPVVIVDPTLGDAPKGLYVPAEVAEAVVDELVPRADIVAPNAWELQRLTGVDVRDASEALAAARLVGKPVMVSSVGRGAEIGAVYADKDEAWLAAHPRGESAPKGTGDLLSALFAAALIDGLTGSHALVRAVSGVAETIAAAQGAAELPIVAMGQKLKAASPHVRLERLA